LASLLIVTACDATSPDDRPQVVTTIAMISDVARNVAGDCVQVTPLMGPGVDPHLYEARASDIERLRNADAILYAGFLLRGRWPTFWKNWAVASRRWRWGGVV